MQDESALISSCPSFNSYASVDVAETAARVAGEMESIDEELNAGDEEEFEFSIVRCGPECYLISDEDEDDLSSLGQIRPIFPVFNPDLLQEDKFQKLDFEDPDVASIRVPLKNLFFEDRERERDPDPPSSSSSESDDSRDAPVGMFCVWTPKAAADASPGSCKKSKSTGSSYRRWRFIDLLRRSNSTDGKDSFVVLTPVPDPKKKRDKSVRSSASAAGKSKANKSPKGGEKFSSAHEIFYVKNRALREGEKRRSFLPYRQDLVGFFAKVNGLGRKYPPF